MIAPSELIINPDGSCFHLHLKPEQLADKIIMVGDPDRVNTVASYFDTKECEVEDCNRLFLSGPMWQQENQSGSTEFCIFMPTPRKCATRLSNQN